MSNFFPSARSVREAAAVRRKIKRQNQTELDSLALFPTIEKVAQAIRVYLKRDIELAVVAGELLVDGYSDDWLGDIEAPAIERHGEYFEVLGDETVEIVRDAFSKVQAELEDQGFVVQSEVYREYAIEAHTVLWYEVVWGLEQ
jgi:hypothetical protein